MKVRFGTFEPVLADRYRFEEELGRGAMGTVYRAYDVRLGRSVAIKLLHPMLTNELGVRRFESEIRIAASLHHPNIIGVHESGEAEGRLYFVMDYLGGETLRARLEREKQLPVDDALQIVQHVAAGLQHAHDRGVVHRDVKPENIILSDGRACVLDFGLARAIGDVDAQRLTASGLSVGTPHYLSPEQASAERDVSSKADQYALACVLFEMLVGEPPFTGPTATSIAMRHIAETPPLVRSRRRTASASIESAVHRAMEKVPADRFESVTAFAAATAATRTPKRSVGRIGVVVSLGVVAMASSLVLRSGSPSMRSASARLASLFGQSLDSSRYVVFPPSQSGVVPTDSAVDGQLAFALSRWSGVSVPTAIELREAMHGQTVAPSTNAEAASVARAVYAGRYVLSELKTDSSGSRLTVEVIDATTRVGPRRYDLLLPSANPARDSAIARIAFFVLFGSDTLRQPVGDVDDAINSTTNRAAMVQYLRARDAMATWNLPLADSALAQATRLDPSFPHATLALAQVRMWAQDVSAQTTQLATRVLEDSARVSDINFLHARALRDMGLQRYVTACAAYEQLVSQNARDFAAWYGVAECNRLDEGVVRKTTSPSGFAYRGSRHRGEVAIERAFDLLPRIDACCIARSIDLQRRHFRFISTAHTRLGRGEGGDSAIYLAYPELVADTLAFTPYPARLLNNGTPATHAIAVEQQRRGLMRIAAKRAASFASNADALELVGEAMELQGEPAAVDTVHRARLLTLSSAQALRLGVYEVWLRVKRAVPGDLAELRAARLLADSIVSSLSHPSSGDASLTASLAALAGNANLAAQLSQHAKPEDRQPGIPNDVSGGARLLLVSAAVGASVDSMRDQEARLVSGIENGVPQRQQALARTMLLARAVALAYPQYRALSLPQLETTSPLLSAEAAHARGAVAQARTLIAGAIRPRTSIRPADRTIDALYPEAWLLAALGDTAAAIAHISPTLDALRQIPARQFFDPVNAGTLMQAMALRANLLAGRGDTVASRRWANAVLALSDSTSAAARDVRRRMRASSK